MSMTFVACVLVAFTWMALFYLWGKGFLTLIHAEREMASDIVFGYLVLQIIYQIIYITFYLCRGSYRATVYIWISVVGVTSFFLLKYIIKNRSKGTQRLKANERVGVLSAAIMVLVLACFIGLHVPFYGADTVDYITRMNEFYYRDFMWISSGELSFHYGMSSMFEFFSIPSLITGIKPYYNSLFSVRIVGIFLFSLVMYRTGSIIFQKDDKMFSWGAIILAVLTPFLLMFWGSNYTAEFFYWRTYEAKGFCQFFLLPLGFSVFLAMFKNNTDRQKVWKEQLLVGLAAVPVSASSLTPYLFLVLMGVFALLAFDKFKHGLVTIRRSFICALPNIMYLLIYILEKKGIVVL